MCDHEPIDPNNIGNDFEDLEQRRLDALCDLLFEGADHSESDRHSNHPHRSHHFPSDQPVSRPDAPWRETSGSLSLHERAGVSAPATRPAAQRTRPTQQTSNRSTLRSRLSLGTLFTGLLLAAFCFFQGASAPIELTRPIEDIRPGHKVIVDAPEEALATDVARLNDLDSSWNASDGKLEVEGIADPLRELTDATNEQITKADYRLVMVQAKEVWEDGTYNEINVATLQPWQWIHQHEVHVGGEAPLPLETVEMNLPVGMTGKVLDILPCPELEQGAGRTVLTTVNRLARGVIELSLRDADGHEETLRPTDEHLFYSTSHGDWLSAGELQVGERLSGTSGPITVATITPLSGTHRVYNMTVQGEHLYRVGGSGVLVHNNCATILEAIEHVRNVPDTVVLGLKNDVVKYADEAGHFVLNVGDWSLAGNRRLIAEVAANNRPVLLASDLMDPKAFWRRPGVSTVTFDEVQQLITDHGYRLVDNMLLPP
ncbi:MAG: hypothetical protein H8E66_31910 [Planctomycetes bacterium]|nr:hypothetical protein [Planctomycetota bacterium]